MTIRQRGLRFQSNALYTLKRRYGTRLTFYRSTETNDFRNSQKTVTKQTFPFNHAIVLPAGLDQKFVYDLSYIATNKNFTMGAIFDTASRRVILDSKDCNGYVPFNRDHFIYDGKRYDVISVDTFAHSLGYIIVGQEIPGADVYGVNNVEASDGCLFTQSVDEELTTP